MVDFVSKLLTKDLVDGIKDVLPSVEIAISNNSYYDQIFMFLIDGMMPAQMITNHRSKMALRRRSFLVIACALYIGRIDQIIRRHVPEYEQQILEEAHQSKLGGHFLGDIGSKKAIEAGLWWTRMLKDAHVYTKECLQC